MTDISEKYNAQPDKVADIFKDILRSSERPTHFKYLRAVKSPLIKLIDLGEGVSDYHLDSYVLHFYGNEKELTLKLWWGDEKPSLIEEKIYPLHMLLVLDK